MQTYDWAWLHQGGKDLRPADAKPKPFNGVHPLRWAVSISYKLPNDKQDRSFRYIGKPSEPVARKLWRIIEQARDGAAYLVEFDKGGAVAYWIGQLPMSEDAISQGRNNRLTQFYRYARSGWSTMTWLGGMVPTIVDFEGKQFVTYGELAASPRRWEDYGQWLQRENLLA